ncbi:MAG: hypothetical protein VX725_04920 [Actinomycetota bacterium]|nr:hypothetical protein [Actinomycetota bacterium]
MVLGKWRKRKRQNFNYAYSAWDGTQTGFDISAEDLLAELGDDLLYDGDVNSALRRMMQSGFNVDGERVQGLQETLDRIRQERQERLENYDLGGVYEEVANELRDVIGKERESLDQLLEEARASGDTRREEITQETVTNRNLQLDMIPPDLAGQVRELQQYDFTSADARQQFEDLMEKLREQLMQQYLDQMSDEMQNMQPEDMQRLKDMIANLNAMLEQRANGQEPDFNQFMEEFGDFFPENPSTLDELLEIMAQRMAAAQAMMNSMTPQQQQQLQELSDQLLEDMDLQWQMDQLAQNLQEAFPNSGWEQSYEFSGDDPMNMAQAQQIFEELGDLDALERMLSSVTNPASLAEVDIERVKELLDEQSATSLEKIAEAAKQLEDAGYIDAKEGRYELTPKAIRKIGQQALADLFRKLNTDRVGNHHLEQQGIGHERDFSTKPYEFGDPFNLDIQRTVRNAIRRAGGGTPVDLLPEDFEIERTESLVRSSTVLMLDLSNSMAWTGRLLPAKKVAMALHSLITMQYPRDYIGIVGFNIVAREIEPHHLPEVSTGYMQGTNMQHALLLSRQMLAKQTGTKQIIMVTDGEPTAHIDQSGNPYFDYPPTRETVEKTLQEVMACTRDGIRINTFMLDPEPALSRFIERITEMNGGRAFFTNRDNLGDYLLVDFVEHRRRLVSARR